MPASPQSEQYEGRAIMTKKIILFWIAAGAIVSAQQKVKQIKFDGLLHLSPSVAKEVAGIREGDKVDAEQIDESVKNLYSQGYFKDVWVEKKANPKSSLVM